jgi:hypothetical protein
MLRAARNNRTNPPHYNNTVGQLALLDRTEVVDALREVHRVYGTAAVLATAELLDGKP